MGQLRHTESCSLRPECKRQASHPKEASCTVESGECIQPHGAEEQATVPLCSQAPTLSKQQGRVGMEAGPPRGWLQTFQTPANMKPLQMRRGLKATVLKIKGRHIVKDLAKITKKRKKEKRKEKLMWLFSTRYNVLRLA